MRYAPLAVRLTPNHKVAILCGLIAIPTAIMAWTKLRADDDRDADDASVPLQKYKIPPRRPHDAARDDAMARRAAVVPALFGLRPGAPGALFAGLDLRRGWSTGPDLGIGLDVFQTATGGRITIGMDEIVVSVPPPPDPLSDDVRVAALSAWRRGDDDRWLDPDDLLRVSMQVDAHGTVVRWQRALPAAALFPPDASTSGSLVPAIGALAVAPLPLDTYATPTATGFGYALPPIGWSPDPVHVEVDVDRGVVTAVHVETGALAKAEYEAVRAALRARYGTKAMLDGPGTWRAGGLALHSTLLVDARLTNQGPLMGYRLDETRAR